MKKPGRNDSCFCGSGKKFKKCCESRMLGGRFKAEKIDLKSSAPIQKTASLSGLFRNRLAATPKKSLPLDVDLPEMKAVSYEVASSLEKKVEHLIS